MSKVIVVSAVLLISAPAASAISQVANLSQAQHAACENALVCATMQDGRSVAITDCKARKDGAVRYLYGDCHDED